MNDVILQSIKCAIRTLGAIALVLALFWGARYVGWTYDDTKTVLGMVNAYFPELVLLAGIGGGAVVFARMSADDSNDFKFSAFFRARGTYDIYRFGYFWLLIIAAWAVFVTAWRDKPLVDLMTVVLGIFIVKGVADSIAGALGKPRAK